MADRRVVRLIQKWLNAGVLEDGKRTRVKEGTPQGGSASPLLANIYLHYVFDLWVQQWRQTAGARRRDRRALCRRLRGGIPASRRMPSGSRAELRERFAEVRPGAASREDAPHRIRSATRPTTGKRRGEGKPETFNFLGFTHICGKKRSNGTFTVLRQTMRKTAAGEAERGESRTAATHARPHPGVGHVAALGRRWAHPVLRRAHEPARRCARFGSRSAGSGIASLSRRSQNGRV